ncbi:MAG: hypothetical protein K6G61_03045 [Solobacterium sp.]|nr:hypothetical protein [Solobacterium sp.]
MKTDRYIRGTAFILFLMTALSASGCFVSAKPEVYEDIESYEERLTAAGNQKWHKWGMDDSIWPAQITGDMQVEGYRTVYYDPFDAQYLGWLEVVYTPEAYEKEMERLRAIPSDAYAGIYSVTEEQTCEPAAVRADPYYGFVYALTDGESRIIYCEQIFCNYFMDLDYTQYIPEEYLLDGFDASADNPYRKERMQ